MTEGLAFVESRKENKMKRVEVDKTMKAIAIFPAKKNKAILKMKIYKMLKPIQLYIFKKGSEMQKILQVHYLFHRLSN